VTTCQQHFTWCWWSSHSSLFQLKHFGEIHTWPYSNAVGGVNKLWLISKCHGHWWLPWLRHVLADPCRRIPVTSLTGTWPLRMSTSGIVSVRTATVWVDSRGRNEELRDTGRASETDLWHKRCRLSLQTSYVMNDSQCISN